MLLSRYIRAVLTEGDIKEFPFWKSPLPGKSDELIIPGVMISRVATQSGVEGLKQIWKFSEMRFREDDNLHYVVFLNVPRETVEALYPSAIAMLEDASACPWDVCEKIDSTDGQFSIFKSKTDRLVYDPSNKWKPVLQYQGGDDLLFWEDEDEAWLVL